VSADKATTAAPAQRLSQDGSLEASEAVLIVEEPLQIVVDGAPYAVLMRTPGDDIPLVAGFCLSEGLVDGSSELGAMQACEQEEVNQVAVTRVGEHPPLRPARQTVASSCGLCGREMVADAMRRVSPLDRRFTISLRDLLTLGDQMQQAQQYFQTTGGTHAAALFDQRGRFLSSGEDVGRHNALDKAIGRLLLENRLDETCVAVLSGRCSFEMVQKTARAGIPVVASVSAPTHLAILLAERAGISLVGFLRSKTLTIYQDAGHLQDLR
jgi:FdhD protein